MPTSVRPSPTRSSPSQRYVALYIGRQTKAVYTAALKAVPGLTVLDARHAPLFEVEATKAAARAVNAMTGWTASVPQVLFEAPNPRPGFPTGTPQRTASNRRTGVASTTGRAGPAGSSGGTHVPARITARRVRTAT